MKKLVSKIFLYIFVSSSYYAFAQINRDDRNTYIQTAKQLYNENKWKEGKAIVDKGLSKYSKDSDLKELSGRYYFKQNEYAKARYAFIKALEYSPRNTSAKQALINVEMATQRYSSAIAYANELLEILPYDKAIWLKKAEAYRLQGNLIESNRLLKRLYHIYPEDKQLKDNLIEYLSEEFRNKKTAVHQMDAILEIALYIINEDPTNQEVYLGLINSYLQARDYEKALVYAEKAVATIPQSLSLLKKRNAILAHLGRYQEILTSLTESMPASQDKAILVQEYHYYLGEAAKYYEKTDYYYSYQALFQKNPRSIEYFNKVYTIALSRNLFDDVLVAIKLAKRERGETKDLLFKESYLYERTGNQSKLRQTIYRLYQLYPEDAAIKYQQSEMYYKEAKDWMADLQYEKALPYLDFIEANADASLIKLAIAAKYTCFRNLGLIKNAERSINKLIDLEPEEADWRFKRAEVFGLNKEYLEALQEYISGVHLTKTERDDKENWRMLGFEELASSYTKAYIEAYDYEKALELVAYWQKQYSRSETPVRYAYNIALQMKDRKKAEEYLQKGLHVFPLSLFLQIKLADSYLQHKEYDAAQALLLPLLEKHAYHREVIAVNTALGIEKSKLLLKHKQAKQSLDVLNKTLFYDPENKELKYRKGLAYEKLQMLDSAAYYQAFYDPSLSELKSYERQMKYLEFRKKNQEVAFFTHVYRFSDQDILTSVAGAEYTHIGKTNTYTGRISYSGRDTGKGIMTQAEWTRSISSELYALLNTSVGTKVFPKFMINAAAYYTFIPTWEAELTLGFRNLADAKKMFNQQIGASKEFEHIRLSTRFNSVILAQKWHYNIAGQSRFYVDEQRNYLAAMASIGSAPDIEAIDNQLYNAYDVTNVMLGFAGYFILNKTCSLDLSSIWYHYKVEKQQFRNMYNLQAKLNIRF